MGSGKYLKHAIKKYGINSFVKEILCVCDTEEEMNTKEAELVTEEFCARNDTYNICVGGKGGFSYINSSTEIIQKRDKIEHKRAGYKAANLSIYNVGREVSEATREKLRSAASKKSSPSFLGKRHSEETKEKMRVSKNVGHKNPQYGTMWITDGRENRKVNPTMPIPEGWYKGRVLQRKK